MTEVRYRFCSSVSGCVGNSLTKGVRYVLFVRYVEALGAKSQAIFNRPQQKKLDYR